MTSSGTTAAVAALTFDVRLADGIKQMFLSLASPGFPSDHRQRTVLAQPGTG
jgi:hypothetical protein